MTSTPSPDRGKADLLRALGVFAEPPGPHLDPLVSALRLSRPPTAEEHTRLFVFELRPYASIYLGPEGMLGGEVAGRIAGLWEALGRTPPREPDHLTSLLGLLAGLEEEAGRADPSRAALVAHASRTLTGQYLASWLGPYLRRVEDVGAAPYRQWAELAAGVLAEEAGDATAELPVETPPRPAGREELIRHLLTPAVGGLILIQADLVRCAKDLGLGLRMGERAYALASLFDQAPERVVGWLRDFAEEWVEIHREISLGPTEAWAARAERTGSLLASLRFL